jgi:hypothetical protein
MLPMSRDRPGVRFTRIQVAYGVSLVSEEAQTREAIVSYEGY